MAPISIERQLYSGSDPIDIDLQVLVHKYVPRTDRWDQLLGKLLRKQPILALRT
jgi:hypothetical protein